MSNWSNWYVEPARSNQMGPMTGMSSGIGKPNISRVKFHNGLLWFCGAWEADKNIYWYLWCYSPERGWWPVSWLKAGSKDGVSPGDGPDGRICDFTWDNAGNLFVAGQFTRVRNSGGTEYVGINALCMYYLTGPESETVDKWRPVGEWHANGTVSHQGSIAVLAWDGDHEDLFIAGGFSGIPGKNSFGIHKFSQRTGQFTPLGHGLYSTPGSHHEVDDMILQYSSPNALPDVIVSGIFKFAGGPKGYPDETCWSRVVSRFDQVKGEWEPFGSGKEFDKIVRGFIQAGNPQGRTICLDSRGNLWLGGGFTSSSLPNIVGIARWNGQEWQDPTGRGGFNRDVFSIFEQSGKIYVLGAFSAFRDGSPANCLAVYDLSTNLWNALGDGLGGVSMPGHFSACCGSRGDIYCAGDFRYAGLQSNQSFYVAHYCESEPIAPPPFRVGVNVKQPSIGKKDGSIDLKISGTPKALVALNGGNLAPKMLFSQLGAGAYSFVISAADGSSYSLSIPLVVPEAGREVAKHWDRWSKQFPKPPNSNSMKGSTGMSDGTGMPDIRDVLWVDGHLYFAGDYQARMGQGHWAVWRWGLQDGWVPVAYRRSQRAEQGPNGIIERMRLRGNELFCVGAFKEVGNVATKGPTLSARGVAVLNLSSGVWTNLSGSFEGVEVNGYVSTGGVVHDVHFDQPERGDVMVGGSFAGLTELNKGIQSWGIHVRKASGVFEPLGKGIYTDPDKPNEVRVICSDPTRGDLYIGGGFVYAGADGRSHVTHRCHSVAKFDRSQKNWVRLGEPGSEGQMLEQWQTVGLGTWVPDKCVASAWPVVRDMAIDNDGRLYVGGALGLPRCHAYVLARWNGTQWEDPTNCHGLSRDIYRFSWNSDRSQLFMSGAFQCTGNLKPVGCVARLKIKSGKLKGLGGSGLTGKTFPVTACDTDGNTLYVGGMFTHAGRAANVRAVPPQESHYVAKWHK